MEVLDCARGIVIGIVNVLEIWSATNVMGVMFLDALVLLISLLTTIVLGLLP